MAAMKGFTEPLPAGGATLVPALTASVRVVQRFQRLAMCSCAMRALSGVPSTKKRAGQRRVGVVVAGFLKQLQADQGVQQDFGGANGALNSAGNLLGRAAVANSGEQVELNAVRMARLAIKPRIISVTSSGKTPAASLPFSMGEILLR